ncbi:MAG TPA: hypothetical protein VMC05_01045 [Xanthobacteraceae bacterium]|nr:hypothetical protein [Xanthobacteraceae bacterium]
MAVCACLALASCAGTSNEDAFSAYVADHWPHWAGGLPSDVPPRPGAPGYRQFIAHGQADQDQLPPPAGGAGLAAAPVFETAPAASGQPARAAAAAPSPVRAGPARPPAPARSVAAAPAAAAPVAAAPVAAQAVPPPVDDDASVVRGGLY